MPNVGSEELGRKMAGHGREGALAAARQVWAAPSVQRFWREAVAALLLTAAPCSTARGRHYEYTL